MSNNRLYIVCKGCKKYVKLASYSPPVPWYIDEKSRKKLNEFWEKHQYKCSEGHKCDGDEITEIVYEDNPLLQDILKKEYGYDK